jgi:maltooligosyltrehalose trehalohydrolase
MTRDWRLDFGATMLGSGVRFRVWAPRARTVEVRLASRDRPVPMVLSEDDVFETTLPGVGAGTDYQYVIDGEHAHPDPVSRWQPHGVHGASRVVDPSSFEWSDSTWRGLPLKELVFYELHCGTFTEQGTFEAVIARLGHLKALGVTAVELMPVGEFPGGRNWGYDGVDLYAPQSTYGGPTGLKKLVDACHRTGLAVVLDVVYNHLGPEGNYLGQYGPYFTSRYRTPWGDAINYDGPGSDGVRRFFVDNALYWVTEYHIDALRLDAIHGIFDFSAQHILEEMALAVHAVAKQADRQVWLIAESDLNDVRVIRPHDLGGHGIDAQWSDDFHHSLHTALTGATRGYFADFAGLRDLPKAIVEGFVYDGVRSRFRERRHGSSSASHPGEQFVICQQNHDQIANGSGGARISQLMSPDGQKLGAALVACSPNLPLLFMGQEYGELAPFFYFTSHGDAALIEAVRRGRREEFLSFDWAGDFPDPQAERTFCASKLDWSLLERPAHASLFRFFRDLLALRKTRAPLNNCRKDLTHVSSSEQGRWLVIERGDPSGQLALCVFNFHTEPGEVPLRPATHGWRLDIDSASPRYGELQGDASGSEQRAPDLLPPDVTSVRIAARSAAVYSGPA